MRHTITAFVVCFALAGAALPACGAEADAKLTPEAIQFFETEVRPVLAANCYKCHSNNTANPKSGLRLDSREEMLKGGERGPAVVPGDWRKSLMIRAIMGRAGALQMPKNNKLQQKEIATLVRWVQLGAPWPAADGAPAVTAAEEDAKDYGKLGPEPAKYAQLRREHWAFQPIHETAPPAPRQAAWAKSDIDRFILAKLEENKLEPSKPADRRTLLRRATLDLTGLPPTPEEVEAFVNDSSSKAFEKVVDRLLASPAFGERWGRHWLDVARYAESTGMTRNTPFYYAWRYRDWVINAFNADKPYDRFIREQVAGDLLPAESDAQRDGQLIATGFLTLGPKDLNERNPLQFTLNNVDEQIDTTTRAFMGLTVACARCHDHKFDPITTAEYYSMAGIFRSTETLAGLSSRRGAMRDMYNPDLLVKLSPASVPKTTTAAGVEQWGAVMPVALVEEQREGKRDKRARQLLKQRRQQLRKLQQQRERLGGAEREIRPVAMGVNDGRLPADSTIFIRGEVSDRGPVVPRGTITLPGIDRITNIPDGRSGRLELAGWIASERNPLTARVMVNRIWHHLFGAGLVRSVDNFGTTGEAPSHPELLDHLALEFMQDGWSVKRAIRRIMLSSAYQQAGTFDQAKYTTDPDNRLLWRMSPRRLEGEAIRDALLATAGTLDPRRPIGSSVMQVPSLGLNNPRRFADRFAPENTMRSVYLPMLRGRSPMALEVFDLADDSQVTGSRDVTTVAPQALYMMNDPFVLEQSKAFARRVISERSADLARIDRAYGLALGRVPKDAERQRALKYIREFTRGAEKDKIRSTTAEVDAWTTLCQALLASAEFRYVN